MVFLSLRAPRKTQGGLGSPVSVRQVVCVYECVCKGAMTPPTPEVEPCSGLSLQRWGLVFCFCPLGLPVREVIALLYAPPPSKFASPQSQKQNLGMHGVQRLTALTPSRPRRDICIPEGDETCLGAPSF